MLTFNTATGTFLVAAFSFGLYSWPSLLLAVLVGLFGMANLILPTEAELRRLEGESD